MNPVVVLDEPLAVLSTGPTAAPFGKRLTELTEDLFSIPDLRVVLTAAEWHVPPEKVVLGTRSVAREVLASERWGALAEAAVVPTAFNPAPQNSIRLQSCARMGATLFSIRRRAVFRIAVWWSRWMSRDR